MSEPWSNLTPEQEEWQKRWNSMKNGKLEFVATPDKIIAQQAHEVAMQAATTIAHLAIQSGAVDNVGSAIAQAYLQAYEAVEGWTKPGLKVSYAVEHEGKMLDSQYAQPKDA